MTATICLALVIFFESGIDPPIGQIATGWSVITASKTLHKHHVSVCREVLYSGHYMAINNRLDEEHNVSIPQGKKWKQAIHIASQIIHKKVPDPTGGANHFECTKWSKCAVPPWWAVGMEYRGRFGTQDFYKETKHDDAT